MNLLTGYQKVAGLIPVWGSEIVFVRLGLDECLSITYSSGMTQRQGRDKIT